MKNDITFSPKQQEFWRECTHRWNIKAGATRSGKTYMDYYVIPARIWGMRGRDGLNVILGNTRGTLQRNIIEPLQSIWNTPQNKLVGDIKNDNTAIIFGEKVHCIGADKISQVNRLRGSSIKYCYGDEVATWNEEVFNILKSRLDKSYSVFDGTCNPESPNHWFKKFLDSERIDIFSQKYTLYDNPYLSDDFVKNLEIEYGGTVYFDRYILGEWKRAEGVVFRDFADNPEKYIISADEVPKIFDVVGVGYDLGGNGSNFALVAAGVTAGGHIYVLKAVEIEPDDIHLEDVENFAKDFIVGTEKKYGVTVDYCYIDDNYFTTVNSLNSWRAMFDSATRVKSVMPLVDRPLMLTRLMAKGNFKVVKDECKPLVYELQNAVFDDRCEKAVICDDGSMNIDCIDALFYAISERYLYLG